MGILDTFFILFKADTTDLEKGQKRADQVQDESADKSKKNQEQYKKNQKSVKDSLDQMEEQLKSTQRTTQGAGLSFLDMATDAAAAIAAVVGLGAATHSVFTTEENTLRLARFGKALGMNTGEIYQWSRAVKNVAGESADILPDISKLTTELNRFQLVGGNITQAPLSGFLRNFINNDIGINKSMTSFDVLLKTAQKVDELRRKGLSESAINSLLTNGNSSSLGLSPDTALFVQQGAKAVADQLADVLARGVPTPEDNARILQFAQNWGYVRQEIESLGRAVSGPFLDFLNSKDDIVQLGEAVGVVAAGFLTLSVFLAAFNIVGPITAIASLTVAMFGLAATAWPILAVAAAIGAVFAIIHYWPQILGGLEKGWDKTWSKIKSIVDETKDQVKGFFDFVQDPAKWYKNHPDFWGKAPRKDNPGTQNYISDDLLHPEKSANSSNIYHPTSSDLMAAAQAQITIAARNPLASQTTNSIVNRGIGQQEASVHIDKIEVSTQATDAAGISQSIAETLSHHLGRAFSQSIANFDNGIHA